MPRNKIIRFKVNDKEEILIESKAKSLGMSLSVYLRFVSLNNQIKVAVPKT